MSHATKQQVSILSTFMEKHPEVAKSYNASSSSGRTNQRLLWEQLVRSLNTNGPPTKTFAEWKRVWTLRKYSTKKKLTHNKNSLKKTGGGPFDIKPLDDTEEAIISACGMEASVSGIEGGLVFGSSANENNSQHITTQTIEQLLEDLDGTPSSILQEISNQTTPKRQQTKTKKEDDLLKKQLDLQEHFFSKQKENANTRNRTLFEIRDAIPELCEIKKNESGVAANLKKEELQVRRMELEVAKLANEIKLLEFNPRQSEDIHQCDK